MFWLAHKLIIRKHLLFLNFFSTSIIKLLFYIKISTFVICCLFGKTCIHLRLTKCKITILRNLIWNFIWNSMNGFSKISSLIHLRLTKEHRIRGVILCRLSEGSLTWRFDHLRLTKQPRICRIRGVILCRLSEES